MDQAPTSQHASDSGHQWAATRRMTALLLLTWFLVTFLCIWFARELNHLNLFGWPVSFYMAAQGMMLIYLGIVAIYMRRMRRLDQLAHQLAHREQPHGE